mmetsp:Transcript_9008/g.14231  ORF Transcript_9008/g.14231 Transcript_9008/m.14231 type:complete len:497 (+) Transcript_9008:60-1550(+)
MAAARRTQSRRENANHRAFGITLREKRDLERAASDSKLGTTSGQAGQDRSAPIKEGWLHVLNPPEKRGGIGEFTLHHKTPLRSFVVLDRKSLVCYPNQPSSEAIRAEREQESVLPKLKVITVGNGYIVTEEDDINVAGLQHAFRVSNGRRAAIFSAPSAGEKTSWVEAIEEAARRISVGHTPNRSQSGGDHRDRMLEETGDVEKPDNWLDRLVMKEEAGEDVDLLRLYATFPAIDKQMIKEIWTNSGKNEAAALRSLKLMAEPVLLNKDKSSSSSDAESGDELLGKQRRDVRKQLLRHRSTPGKFASGRTDWQHRVKGLLDNTSDDDETRPPPAADEMRGQLRIGINGLTAASPARRPGNEIPCGKWREEVQMLVEMGFEEGKVLSALDDALGDVNEALNHLGFDEPVGRASPEQTPSRPAQADDEFPPYREEDFGPSECVGDFPAYREEDFGGPTSRAHTKETDFPPYREEEFQISHGIQISPIAAGNVAQEVKP